MPTVWNAMLLLLLLCVTNTGPIMMIQMVQAKCKVKDAKGNEISLDKLPPDIRYVPGDKNFPPGMPQIDISDELHCDQNSACKGMTISNCFFVKCAGSSSCSNANLKDNTIVGCGKVGACRGSIIGLSFNVACGGNHVDACAQSTIVAEGMIWCAGQFACSSNRGEEIIFKVGRTGWVECSGGNGHLTCKNMIVHVDHGRRACYGTNDDDIGHCAVMCAAKSDCDKDSIKFIVG
ncbi:hypothetical protein ACA910_011213 [Epithemia clementina (nom. ined.)]